MDIFYPYELFSNWLTFSFFQITHTSPTGKTVLFFIYNTLKILTLMLFITHIMSAIRHYLPTQKICNILASKELYGLDYFFATLFGALTPFCSCSSTPLFIGFLQARLPLGVTFAFMTTSPLINEIAIALFIGIFGWQITLLYIFFGITIGIVNGLILDKLRMERYIEDFVWKQQVENLNSNTSQKHFLKIFLIISRDAFEITKKIIPYLLIGIGIGAFIHGYVPEEFFEKCLEKTGIWGVPLAVILAVPLYGNASSVIPIVQSLILNGIPIGTAFAFMMAIVGLSLPEALILKKVLKWPLLLTFFGIVTIGIILIGYLLNFLF